MVNYTQDFDGDELKSIKHLIFKLKERDYGIPIQYVNEIIGLMDITPVPKTPLFFKGVINLRGKIIPVIDLRLKLNIEEKNYDEKTCIIIVNILNNNVEEVIGIVVDVVSEVYDILLSEIENNFECGVPLDENLLNGVGKIKDKVVMLLDINSIINLEIINKFVNENKITEGSESRI